MASTETELLKIIWDNKGKASLSKIEESLELRFNLDYIRLICQGLIKKKFVEFSEGQYKITNLGKKELEKIGIIRTSLRSKLEKVIKPKPKGIAKKERGKIKGKRKKAAIKEVSELNPELIKILKKKGLQSLEDIATTTVSRLIEEIPDLKLEKAAKIINEARDKLRKEGKEYLWIE